MYEIAVVPIDGSELSRKALAQVPHVSPRTVVLVSVMESVASAMARQTGVVADIPPGMASTVADAEARRLRQVLDAAREELNSLGWSGPVTLVVRHGHAGEEIVALAKEMAADIVVMSTHGRTGIRRAVMGSVADYVVRELRGVAVLLIHPGGHPPSG